MTPEPQPRARVVIALEAAGSDETTIELARVLVATGNPELVGVLVENVRVLEHARSRLAREIIHSGVERRLDATALEHQIRAQSARVKARFEAAAVRLGLPHAFELARGEPVTELATRLAEAEALIIGIAATAYIAGARAESALRKLFESPPRIVLFARDGLRGTGAIVTLVGSEDPAGPLLEAATKLAKETSAPVAVLLTGAALAHRERTLRRVTAFLGDRGVRFGDVVALSRPSAAAIAQIARVCHARLVVLPTPDAEDAFDLLRRLPTPLLFVREE